MQYLSKWRINETDAFGQILIATPCGTLVKMDILEVLPSPSDFQK